MHGWVLRKYRWGARNFHRLIPGMVRAMGQEAAALCAELNGCDSFPRETAGASLQARVAVPSAREGRSSLVTGPSSHE